MAFVRGWAICLVGIILLVTIAEMLLPSSNTKKYVKTILSLLVLLVLLKPLGETKNIVFENFDIEVEIPEIQNKDFYIETFQQNLKDDIKVRFNVESQVEAGYDEQNQIVIKQITIKGKGDEIKDELERIYGKVKISFE